MNHKIADNFCTDNDKYMNEEKFNFYPMHEVLIAWNPYENKEKHRKIELQVFLWNDEAIAYYDTVSRDKDPYYAFAATTGRCCSGWQNYSRDEMICECWRILLGYPTLDIKSSLIEFGKMRELESLRIMTFRCFFISEFNEDYEEFLNHFYG